MAATPAATITLTAPAAGSHPGPVTPQHAGAVTPKVEAVAAAGSGAAPVVGSGPPAGPPAGLPALKVAQSTHSNLPPQPAAPPPPVYSHESRTIVIFSVNDVYLVDNMPRVRTHIQRRLARGTTHGAPAGMHVPYNRSFTTLPGDFLGPSALSAFDNGNHMLEAMRLLGVNRICLGNHEFDFGQKTLEEQVNKILRGVQLPAPGQAPLSPEGKQSARAPPAKKDGPIICEVLNANISGGLSGTKPFCLDEIPMPTGLKTASGGSSFRLGWFGTCTTDTVAMVGKEKMGKMEFSPHLDANKKMTVLLKDEHKADFIVGLTHQWATEDRPMMGEMHALDLALGGHDHQPHLYRWDADHKEHHEPDPGAFKGDDGASRNRWLVKVGENASHVGVIEIDMVTGHIVSVEMNDIKDDPPEPQLQWLVDRVADQVTALQGFCFYPAPKDGEVPLSSEKPRFHQCTLGRLFSTLLRDWNEADMCLWHGGNIRAGKTYYDGFYMADLQTELPFPAHPIKVTIRGAELPALIKWSHTKNYPGYGSYWQLDDGCVWDAAAGVFTQIANAPFSPERLYEVVMDVKLLTGMDNFEPLLKLKAEGKIGGASERHIRHANDGSSSQRDQILSALVEDQWERVFGGKTWAELDLDHDGVLSASEVEHGVINRELLAIVMRLGDTAGKGVITQQDFDGAAQRKHRVSMAGLEKEHEHKDNKATAAAATAAH